MKNGRSLLAACRRLAMLLACLGLAPAAAAADAASAAAEVGAHLARLEKLGFAGAVVVARDGVPLLAAGYGLADRERAIPWTPSTVSTVGSITKQFTGAAVLALQEEGKLSVTDPIERHFEGVPEDKRGITLHHLLTHSSGIVNLEGADDWNPIGREEFVRRALAQPLEFEPAARYAYSNAGYSLLGAIVEQRTGKSWEEYVRERIFLPAGMYDTGYIGAPWGEARLAQGYRGGERWGTVVERPFAEDGPFWVLRANGGVHSTAWDMLRWGQTLLGGRPLSADSMAAYWSPHVDEGGGTFYGYGWVVMDLGGARVITHNGGNGIFFADMAIVPDAGLVVVLLTNVAADFGIAEGLLEKIGMRMLGGAPLPAVPDVAEPPPTDLERWAGSYRLPEGGAIRVAAAGGGLAIEAEDPRAFAALHSTRALDPVRAERLSGRIDAIVSAYLGGDFRPLAEAYRGRVTAEYLREGWEAARARLEESHGRLVGHRLLGTALREDDDVTVVEFRCENGSDFRTYVWDAAEEEKLLGVSRRGLDPRLQVVAETGGGFATWDVRTGASRPVRLEAVEGGGTRLAIGSEPGIEARRRP